MDAAQEAAMSGAASRRAPVLSAQELSLAAGARTLISGFAQRFEAGELWCIAGPNGAGKTTLMSALAGILSPSAGHVELGGRALPRWPAAALARQRAWLPQTVRDAFSASVLETVLLGRHPYLAGWGWEQSADLSAAVSALEALGLASFAARDILSLSGGERQRVALATVLCQDAPLMLLDEPLAHLDLHHQIDCLAVLSERVKAGAAVIFSCHDLNLARRYASHALLLDGAGGIAAGPAREVLSAAQASRAFGYPLVLIERDGHEALVPA
jgi:ABC-type cobalamin/Fe3+-siderophores transport system ATPase subunit